MQLATPRPAEMGFVCILAAEHIRVVRVSRGLIHTSFMTMLQLTKGNGYGSSPSLG